MRIPVKGLGDGGVVLDQEGYELGQNVLTSASNMRMYNGWAEKVRGHVQVFDPTPETPLWDVPFSTGSSRYIVSAGRKSIFANSGSGWADITGAALTASLNDRPSGGVLGGVVVFNNGVDIPRYWGGNTATPSANLTAWSSSDRCAILIPFGYYLFALNITRSGTNGPRRVMWSSAAEPGAIPASWTASLDNDAGEVDINGDGVIVDAQELNGQLIIYLERSMVVARYVGGNQVFAFDVLADPIGIMARGCVDACPLGHVVLTQGDVVLNTGNGVRSILDGVARDYLNNNIDTNYFAQSFVVSNYKKNEVWICFPETGNPYCTKAIIWNWTTGKIGLRSLPNVTYGCAGVTNYASNSFDSATSTFDAAVGTFDGTSPVFSQNETHLFLTSSAGKIYAMDVSDLFDGSTFTGSIERTGLNEFDEAPQLKDRVKTCKRMWPKVDADIGTVITFNLGASFDAETAPTYSGAFTFTVGTDRWVDLWATGVFLAWKAQSDGWFRIRQLDFDIEDGGQF